MTVIVHYVLFITHHTLLTYTSYTTYIHAHHTYTIHYTLYTDVTLQLSGASVVVDLCADSDDETTAKPRYVLCTVWCRVYV